MKRIIILFGWIIITGNIFAQQGEAPLSKGDMQVNFGLGFGYWGLPIYASFDFAVHDDVTVGPDISGIFDFERNTAYFGVAARGDYHFNRIIGIPSEWDFYAGARLGFRAGSNFEALFGIQVGGRWYWDDRWGLNLEFGGGYNSFAVRTGVSLKL